jgi:hypothetical protein
MGWARAGLFAHLFAAVAFGPSGADDSDGRSPRYGLLSQWRCGGTDTRQPRLRLRVPQLLAHEDRGVVFGAPRAAHLLPRHVGTVEKQLGSRRRYTLGTDRSIGK